ncbi:MAG: hypothetical protein [Microviridae sp.]|nr:MAG: hypothetical protein [Microviridae sp.]
MVKFFNAWNNPPVVPAEKNTLPSCTEPGLTQSIDDLVAQCLRTGFIPQPAEEEYDYRDGDDFQELPEEFDNLLDLELVDYSAIVDAGIAAYHNLVAEGKINKDGTPVGKTSEKVPSEPKKPVNEGENSPAVDEALEELQ